jgi:hypothetical protein
MVVGAFQSTAMEQNILLQRCFVLVPVVAAASSNQRKKEEEQVHIMINFSSF